MFDENSLCTVLDPECPAREETPADPLFERVTVEHEHHCNVLLNATVMMVDDESTTTDVVQAFLEDAGYKHFLTTNHSDRALELMTNEVPDVVLLDLMMPKVSGFDILAAMQADSTLKHIPAIVLTSSNDSDTKLKALQLGATDFLAKPVDPSELALRLRNTLAAKAYQDRLANYDSLTNLPNRRMFMHRLNWALRHVKRGGEIGAVLHIDLDRFKQINDTLGHSVGDTLLKEIAQRLKQCIRASDSVGRPGLNNSRTNLSRVGGDEFYALLPEIGCAENATHVSRRIQAALSEPFHAESHELFVTASIGIAFFGDDGEDMDTVLKRADIAMNHAKRNGGNIYEFYSREMNTRSVERLSLESQLRKALDRDELLLHYQPKVSTRTGHVKGMEALVRWQHPELGMVSPGEFIPMAEETGLIVPIGEWVLHTACKQTKAWHSAGLGALCVAVNVSSHQFRQRGFLQTIHESVENSGLAPEYLALELTENVIMSNARENIEALHQIKAMGLKLSVDDFGTGYSSLSYLTQFPLDELKVDRAFISEIRSVSDNAPIVAAIIAMARSLELSVVAEGVETEEQLDFLTAQGCDEYQGYLFSKPVSEVEFAALLVERARVF